MSAIALEGDSVMVNIKNITLLSMASALAVSALAVTHVNADTVTPEIDKRYKLAAMKRTLDAIVEKSTLLKSFHFEYIIVSIKNPKSDFDYAIMTQAELKTVVKHNTILK